MKETDFMEALREAFNEGCRQGEDSATAFEWGSNPCQTDDSAFADLTAEWQFSFPTPITKILTEIRGTNNG